MNCSVSFTCRYPLGLLPKYEFYFPYAIVKAITSRLYLRLNLGFIKDSLKGGYSYDYGGFSKNFH